MAVWRHVVGVWHVWRKRQVHTTTTTVISTESTKATEAGDRPALIGFQIEEYSLSSRCAAWRVRSARRHDSKPEPLRVRRSHHQQQREVTLTGVTLTGRSASWSAFTSLLSSKRLTKLLYKYVQFKTVPLLISEDALDMLGAFKAPPQCLLNFHSETS